MALKELFLLFQNCNAIYVLQCIVSSLSFNLLVLYLLVVDNNAINWDYMEPLGFTCSLWFMRDTPFHCLVSCFILIGEILPCWTEGNSVLCSIKGFHLCFHLKRLLYKYKNRIIHVKLDLSLIHQQVQNNKLMDKFVKLHIE